MRLLRFNSTQKKCDHNTDLKSVVSQPVTIFFSDLPVKKPEHAYFSLKFQLKKIFPF